VETGKMNVESYDRNIRFTLGVILLAADFYILGGLITITGL